MKLQPSPPVLVIGLGNDYRGDDGIGLVLARRLKARLQGKAPVLENSGDGPALMETWRGASAVILVDAAHSTSNPGTIHRLDAGARPISSRFFHHSTHAFSVAEAIELARVLGQLPPRCIVYAIEGDNFSAGTELSLEVESALAEAECRVCEEITHLASETSAS